jgi:hypothetical protein
MKKNYFFSGILISIIILLSGCTQQDSGNLHTTTINAIQKIDEPKIENIGVEIDFYNKKTNKAGDFFFHDFVYPWGDEIYNEKVFYDYGETRINEDGTTELEPQPIFIVPLGTKVRAITSGKVLDVKKLYSDDYTIMVVKPENPKWVYEHEHVINPLIDVGENVSAGQIIAEVSDYSPWLKDDGYGVLDIGILTTEDNGTPLHHCPFIYLDESVKQDYFEKINKLYESWEEYRNDSSIYEENENVVPGCITIEPIAR